MTDDTDDQPLDRLDQIAVWLHLNQRRPVWELLQGLASGWPDATATELVKGHDRMIEMYKEDIEREMRPIRRRLELQVISNPDLGEVAEWLINGGLSDEPEAKRWETVKERFPHITSDEWDQVVSMVADTLADLSARQPKTEDE